MRLSRARNSCRFCCLTLLAAVCTPALAPRAAAQGREQCLDAHVKAQTLRMQGSLLAARAELLVCGQSGCPGPITNDCTGWLSEVDNDLSSVVFAVSDAANTDLTEVRIYANGKLIAERADGRSLTLDPGSYVFRFEAPGFARVERTVALRQSEKNRILRVRLAPTAAPLSAAGTTAARPTPSQQPTAASPTAQDGLHIPLASYVLGATALVGAGVFTYFGLSGNARKDEVEHCKRDCDALIRAGMRDYIAADIGLAVAALSVPAALIAFALHTPDQKPSAQLQIAPQQRGAALLLRGKF